eukprot:gene17845-24231_t
MPACLASAPPNSSRRPTHPHVKTMTGGCRLRCHGRVCHPRPAMRSALSLAIVTEAAQTPKKQGVWRRGFEEGIGYLALEEDGELLGSDSMRRKKKKKKKKEVGEDTEVLPMPPPIPGSPGTLPPNESRTTTPPPNDSRAPTPPPNNPRGATPLDSRAHTPLVIMEAAPEAAAGPRMRASLIPENDKGPAMEKELMTSAAWMDAAGAAEAEEAARAFNALRGATQTGADSTLTDGGALSDGSTAITDVDNKIEVADTLTDGGETMTDGGETMTDGGETMTNDANRRAVIPRASGPLGTVSQQAELAASRLVSQQPAGWAKTPPSGLGDETVDPKLKSRKERKKQKEVEKAEKARAKAEKEAAKTEKERGKAERREVREEEKAVKKAERKVEKLAEKKRRRAEEARMAQEEAEQEMRNAETRALVLAGLANALNNEPAIGNLRSAAVVTDYGVALETDDEMLAAVEEEEEVEEEWIKDVTPRSSRRIPTVDPTAALGNFLGGADEEDDQDLPFTPQPLSDGEAAGARVFCPVPHVTDGEAAGAKVFCPVPHVTDGEAAGARVFCPVPHVTDGEAAGARVFCPVPHVTDGEAAGARVFCPVPHVTGRISGTDVGEDSLDDESDEEETFKKPPESADVVQARMDAREMRRRLAALQIEDRFHVMFHDLRKLNALTVIFFLALILRNTVVGLLIGIQEGAQVVPGSELAKALNLALVCVNGVFLLWLVGVRPFKSFWRYALFGGCALLDTLAAACVLYLQYNTSSVQTQDAMFGIQICLLAIQTIATWVIVISFLVEFIRQYRRDKELDRLLDQAELRIMQLNYEAKKSFTQSVRRHQDAAEHETAIQAAIKQGQIEARASTSAGSASHEPLAMAAPPALPGSLPPGSGELVEQSRTEAGPKPTVSTSAGSASYEPLAPTPRVDPTTDSSVLRLSPSELIRAMDDDGPPGTPGSAFGSFRSPSMGPRSLAATPEASRQLSSR